MDEGERHAVFRRRREPARIVVDGVSAAPNEQHQPVSLGAAILLVADRDEPGNASVAFGEGETLSREDCLALKRRYKDDLLLDDAAHRDRARFTDMHRSPGSGTGPGS